MLLNTRMMPRAEVTGHPLGWPSLTPVQGTCLQLCAFVALCSYSVLASFQYLSLPEVTLISCLLPGGKELVCSSLLDGHSVPRTEPGDKRWLRE